MAISARLDELKKKFDENPRRYFAPLANEYRKQGDTTQAIALCRTHLPNQPGHISGHIVLAQALYECRELAESRLIFEAALELDPENIIALRYLGDIAREQGSPAAAQAWYRRVLEFDPRNEEIAQLLADVREDAAVELADIASRPTPAAGAESSFQPEDTALAQQEPIETAMPDQEAVAPSAATASLEIQATESTQTPTIASFEPEATASIELEAAAGASEIAEEPLDLYDADPTGDAWRESIAEEAGPATRLPGQAAELASAAEHVPDIKEIKATNEPSFDDWFAQPAAQDVAASQEPALEEFAPDLAAAAPAEESRAAADAIEEFTWSFTDTARVPGAEQARAGAAYRGELAGRAGDRVQPVGRAECEYAETPHVACRRRRTTRSGRPSHFLRSTTQRTARPSRRECLTSPPRLSGVNLRRSRARTTPISKLLNEI
jgi:hypothetical protein